LNRFGFKASANFPVISFLVTFGHLLPIISEKERLFVMHVNIKACFFYSQKLLALPEHLSSPPVFSGVHVTRSLILYVIKTSLKIPKEQSESVYRRRTENTMAKRKSQKGQTTIDKTYI
jgi:hypothetical protein